MALSIPKIGLPQMLKQGAQHQQGLEEAVFRNIAATRELAELTRTSLGPNGKVLHFLLKLYFSTHSFIT